MVETDGPSLLSSSSNVDTALLTVGYALHLTHASLSRISDARLLLAARHLAKKLSNAAPHALLPNEALVATITTDPASRLARTQQSVKALSGLIDEFRVFMRLWGLFKIWSWGAGLRRSPPKDGVLRWTSWMQVGACFTLQFLENRAYLASKGVLGHAKSKVAKWYIWSARLWACHILLEFVRLAREATLERAQEPASTEDSKEAKSEKVKKVAKWWRDIYVSAAWMPLTIHWSMAEGFASEGFVAALGLVPGVLGLREAWRASA